MSSQESCTTKRDDHQQVKLPSILRVSQTHDRLVQVRVCYMYGSNSYHCYESSEVICISGGLPAVPSSSDLTMGYPAAIVDPDQSCDGAAGDFSAIREVNAGGVGCDDCSPGTSGYLSRSPGTCEYAIRSPGALCAAIVSGFRLRHSRRASTQILRSKDNPTPSPTPRAIWVSW